MIAGAAKAPSAARRVMPFVMFSILPLLPLRLAGLLPVLHDRFCVDFGCLASSPSPVHLGCAIVVLCETTHHRLIERGERRAENLSRQITQPFADAPRPQAADMLRAAVFEPAGSMSAA